jgi:hypothetical protein
MARSRSARRARRGGVALGVAVAAALVAATAGALVATLDGPSRPEPVGGPGTAPAQVAHLAPTGEVNEMGLPVVEVPGYASGTAAAAGVTVQGAQWSLGRVPLNVAVRPFWTLTNTGPEPVRLGEPKAEVRAGCCPGPFSLGARTLAPGESTVLTFELAMHEGMDGWHDMGVYVPIETASDDQAWLELGVTGDFRD